MTTDELTTNITHDIPFTFVKLGDGELLCMRGTDGQNCDGHRYFSQLGADLRDAFAYLGNRPDVCIALFSDVVPSRGLRGSFDADVERMCNELAIAPTVADNYCMLLHKTYNMKRPLRDFWCAVAGYTGRKVLVAPERLAGVANMLGCARHITVPVRDAYLDIETVQNHCMREVDDGAAMFVFCAGMPAKRLIHKLHERTGGGAYLIDAGSSFDSLFVGDTRVDQATREDAIELYRGTNIML